MSLLALPPPPRFLTINVINNSDSWKNVKNEIPINMSVIPPNSAENRHVNFRAMPSKTTEALIISIYIILLTVTKFRQISDIINVDIVEQ